MIETLPNWLSAASPASWPLTVKLLAFIAVVYFPIAWLYRLTIHPLAKYPGPLRYKISDWPIVYQCYKGNRHLHSLRDHEKYGPIVRTGPNSLSFSSSTALHQIYGSKTINVCKGEFYKIIDSGAGAMSTFNELDKGKHAMRRRVLSHGFSENALRFSEQFIIGHVKKCCKLIGPTKDEDAEGWSGARDMKPWMIWLTYDIMGDLAFGTQLNCVEKDDNRYMPVAVTEGTKFVYWFAYLPHAALLQPIMTSNFMQWVGGKTARDNAIYYSYADEQCSLRLEAEEKAIKSGLATHRKDIMHYLMSNVDSKTGWRPSVDELKAESISLIGAGAETIATTLNAVLFYLLHNPTTLDKLVSEIRSTFQSEEEIHSGPKLESCVYLSSCVEEALRLASPVASALPREVMAGGVSIDGEHIPEGITVGVPPYVIHHDPEIFPEPWKFRPERWIASDDTGVSRDSVERATKAMTPFSHGSRGCIGKALSYLEIKITLVYLLMLYDIREKEGQSVGGGRIGLEKGREREDEYQLFDCFGADREGPIVELRRREYLKSQ